MRCWCWLLLACVQVGLSAEKVWPCNCELAAFFRIEVEGSEYKNIVNQDGASDLVCDWEEEHPDKTLEGCTQDNCYDFKSLSEVCSLCRRSPPFGVDCRSSSRRRYPLTHCHTSCLHACLAVDRLSVHVKVTAQQSAGE